MQHTEEVLKAAKVGLETLLAKVENELASLTGRRLAPRSWENTPAKCAPRRKMSKAGRKAIGEAQRKRWAEYHRKEAARG